MSEALTIDLGYKPRPFQAALHRSLKRFNVAVCHRRFGKSYFSLRHLQIQMLQNKKTRPQYAYIAPTYAQAKKVAWDYAKEFFSKLPGFKSYEQELKIEISHPYIQGDKCVLYLIGADNPDSIRGIYLDGVVIDEYAQIAPSLWGKVVFPTLVDRTGWAIFIGTPSGHNHFSKLYHEAEESKIKDPNSEWFAITLKASQTKVIPEDELAVVRANSTEEDYRQEFECDWSAANKGTYYDSYMTKAEEEGRITSVPYDPAALVHTAWDLGIDDHMVIWFYQVVGREIHVIDHIEDNDKGLDYYLKVVKEKPYNYGTHFFPHDANQRELTNGGRARIEVITEILGNNCEVLKRISVEDGINAVRMILNRCWFDKKQCYRGILALKNYRKKFNEKLNTYSGAVHDEFSHSADGFRVLGLSLSRDLGRMNDVRGSFTKYDRVETPSNLWGF